MLFSDQDRFGCKVFGIFEYSLKIVVFNNFADLHTSMCLV
jgi:hypothetical protein